MFESSPATRKSVLKVNLEEQIMQEIPEESDYTNSSPISGNLRKNKSIIGHQVTVGAFEGGN